MVGPDESACLGSYCGICVTLLFFAQWCIFRTNVNTDSGSTYTAIQIEGEHFSGVFGISVHIHGNGIHRHWAL